MMGPIVLSGAPTVNLNPATKAYVDALAFAAVDLPAQGGNAGKDRSRKKTTKNKFRRRPWSAHFSGMLPTRIAVRTQKRHL